MANRFWVGGTNNWDSTAGTKWATSSGGAGGAAVPTSSDNVFFDGNSGSPVVTITATANVASIDFTGYAGSLAGSNGLNVAGDLTLAASMTLSYTGQIQLTSTTAQNVTTHGKTLSSALVFNGAGGSWTLQDALTTSGALTLTAGTLTLGGHAVSCPSLSTSNSNTRTLDLTSSTLTLTGTGTVFTCSTSTGLTLVSTGSEIIANDSSATAKTLTLDGESYAKITFSGAGPLTLNATGTIGLLTIGAATTSVDTTGFTINGLDFTTFAGTWTSTASLTLTGDLVLNSGMTVVGLNGTLTLSGSAARNLSTAGIVLQCGITIDCTGGTVTCAGDVAIAQGKTLLLKNGTFDANGHNVTAGFVDTTGSTNARTLSMGSGTWTLNPGESGATSPWLTTPTTNLTINGGTSLVHMTNAAFAKTFDGGGFTYGDLTFDGTGSGTLAIQGSNTFRNVTIGIARTVVFTASTTTTVADLISQGTGASPISLASSSAGTQFMLSKSNGRTKSMDYASIKDCLMTGGALWFVGKHSTNLGNNRGQRYMAAGNQNGLYGIGAA